MSYTKEALVTLLEVGNKVKDAVVDDGKINFTESVGIAMKAVQLVSVFKSLPEIQEELKVITEADVVELVTIFKEKFDLPNDAAEQTVEQGLEVLAQLALMIFKK